MYCARVTARTVTPAIMNPTDTTGMNGKITFKIASGSGSSGSTYGVVETATTPRRNSIAPSLSGSV